MLLILFRLFVLLLFGLAGYVIWRMLIRSRWFNRLCQHWLPSTEDEIETLETLDHVELTAQRQADAAERLAEQKALTAETLRSRLRRNPSLLK